MKFVCGPMHGQEVLNPKGHDYIDVVVGGGLSADGVFRQTLHRYFRRVRPTGEHFFACSESSEEDVLAAVEKMLNKDGRLGP